MNGERIAWFATKGSGTNEALRMEELLKDFPNAMELDFDKAAKWLSFKRLLRRIKQLKPNLLVMEGTGIAGGAACLLSWLFSGIPYVVSSGDAVGPFFRGEHPILGWVFELYEWTLCRLCAGFIGWTPYLCGRAMTFGAPRAMTAEGWVQDKEASSEARGSLRAKWGVPLGATVVGLIGSLAWNARRSYCYGMELVEAARRSRSERAVCVIIGEGTGLQRLKERAGDIIGTKVFFPGPIPGNQVLAALSAFDGAVLPQSRDGVGMFRYSTKLSEYLASGVSIAINRIPAAYDLRIPNLSRLPGSAPWDPLFHQALAEWMDSLKARERSLPAPSLDSGCFNREAQRARVHAFVSDLLHELLLAARTPR